MVADAKGGGTVGKGACTVLCMICGNEEPVMGIDEPHALKHKRQGLVHQGEYQGCDCETAYQNSSSEIRKQMDAQAVERRIKRRTNKTTVGRTVLVNYDLDWKYGDVRKATQGLETDKDADCLFSWPLKSKQEEIDSMKNGSQTVESRSPGEHRMGCILS